jgi:hypothetical protein
MRVVGSGNGRKSWKVGELGGDCEALLGDRAAQWHVVGGGPTGLDSHEIVPVEQNLGRYGEP